MPTLIIDSSEVRSLHKGNGHRDPRITECWEGVTVVPPIPTDEHQDIVTGFTTALAYVLLLPGLAKVRPGVNVSDRNKGWLHNYRCPDVVVYFPENPATNHNTHWEGGPDFLIEVISKTEDPTAKFDFYSKVGAREILIVERNPWALELFKLENGAYVSAGRSTPEHHEIILSAVVPFTFAIGLGHPRPRIEMIHTTTGQVWKA